MDPFRGLGMPRIPGLSELLTILQTQTEALSQLPRTLSDLNGTVRELTQATTMARDTIASAQLESFDQQMAVFERILDPLAVIGADEVADGLLAAGPGRAPLHERIEDPLEHRHLLVEGLQL